MDAGDLADAACNLQDIAQKPPEIGCVLAFDDDAVAVLAADLLVGERHRSQHAQGELFLPCVELFLHAGDQHLCADLHLRERFAADADDTDVTERREQQRLPNGKLLLRKAFVILLCRKAQDVMVRHERLQNGASGLAAAPASAHDLRDEGERALIAPKIAGIERFIHAQDADERHIREIQPLADHLRAKHDVVFAPAEHLEALLIGVAGANRIRVHAQDPRVREADTQLILQTLRAEAHAPQMDAPACRTVLRHRAHRTAVVAVQVPVRLVKGHRNGAVLAVHRLIAGGTLDDRMIPAQDTLPEGGLGNVIALPLQGKALLDGNSAFVDENWNAYEDQLKVLAGTKRLTRQELEDYLSLWYSAGNKEDDGSDAPWNTESGIDAEGVKGVVHIVLADRIYIDSSGMSNKMKRQIRRLAAFSNRQYFQNQAMDIPNYDESRFIYLGDDEGKYIILPRGLREEILRRFDTAEIGYEIDDRRVDGRKIKVSFNGVLRESQIQAVETMLENETGILHAATAFGKTVVCCDMIARRGVSTLILVERADLMNQWLNRLEEFLKIDEELPEYQTKTGRTKKRKSLIGNLQGAHDTLTGIVDVAMIRSLKKKDGFHPMLKEYGQVYFDECHHAASDSAIEVLQEINAKFVYGVTATPKRGDGKEKINEFLLGPVRYRFTAKDRALEQNIDHLVYPRFTRTVKPHHLSKTPYGHDAFELIRNNDVRDEQIVRDVVSCVKAGRTPVVLTKYVDHANKLAERLQSYVDRLILLTGSNGTKARRAQVEELNGVADSDSLILVGTGSLLGEGFDYPRLDTLFMATPVSGENVVEQYVGRLNRDYEGKENVIVYDYVDSHIPKFDKMYSARLRAYKKIGYELCVSMDGEKQKANAIYDIDTYAETYWRDLEEAKSGVIVSSPRLNTQKVNRMIDVLRSRQELGVKVTVVTWHPDAYKYGRDDVRMELLERLRKAGFEIRLVEDSCEHYAVIDHEIVWYGSMNLLSKEDVDDNLMRVCSKEIAAELLEMTFGR